MMGIYQCWLYFQSKREVINANQNLEQEQQNIITFENTIKENIETAKNLEKEIEEISKKSETVSYRLILRSNSFFRFPCL